MGFRIFASGSHKFHYKKDNFIDGRDFEPMKIVSILMTMSPTGLGVADAYISHKSKGITDLMESLATTEFLHNLNNAVCFLAMCSGSSDGWISVATTEKHTFWPDTKGYEEYRFSPGDNPGAEFIRLIGPSLKETDLNNWGVILALGLVLGRYANRIGQDARPMINISLTH